MKNCFLYKCIYFGLFWNEDDNIFVYIVYLVFKIYGNKL